MFVGHYSVAFAGRTEQNKIPLWVLFIAVQFLDYIWATLVLLGIEKLRVVKGFTAGSMLELVFPPLFPQFDCGGRVVMHCRSCLQDILHPTRLPVQEKRCFYRRRSCFLALDSR